MAGISHLRGTNTTSDDHSVNERHKLSQARGRTLRDSLFNENSALMWSAPAERSGDGALDLRVISRKLIESAVAASLCRRTPKAALVLFDVIPMHPRIGLRPIASLEEYVVFSLARHHLHAAGNIL